MRGKKAKLARTIVYGSDLSSRYRDYFQFGRSTVFADEKRQEYQRVKKQIKEKTYNVK